MEGIENILRVGKSDADKRGDGVNKFAEFVEGPSCLVLCPFQRVKLTCMTPNRVQRSGQPGAAAEARQRGDLREGAQDPQELLRL